MELNGSFIFHNVGHGLFYSGRIEKFNFIYDCGSLNKSRVCQIIEKYKNELHNKQIDLLILSHFHDDHIIGLDTLLKDIDVNTVVIPYFDPYERLILALSNTTLDEWYYEFLWDPVNYLLKKVKKIIIIGGNGAYIKENEHDSPSDTINENIEIYMPDDEDLIRIIKEYESDTKINDFIEKRKVLVKHHNGHIKACNVWLFRFFNYKLELTKFAEFKKCLSDHGINNPKQAITNKKLRKKLKEKCYYPLYGKSNLNRSSLIAYHGPILEHKYEVNCFFSSGDICGLKKYVDCPIIVKNILNKQSITNNRYDYFGQFLTGDINLNYKYEEIKKHYSDYFDTIFAIQIPHHGAIGNWNCKILSEDGTKNCRLYVVSSSSKSGINPDIVYDIISKPCYFAWCNDRCDKNKNQKDCNNEKTNNKKSFNIEIKFSIKYAN